MSVAFYDILIMLGKRKKKKRNTFLKSIKPESDFCYSDILVLNILSTFWT